MKSSCAAVSLVVLMWASGAIAAPQAQPPADQAAKPPTVTAPTLIRVDGQLKTAAGEARTGLVPMVVSIYAEKDDTTPLWVENQAVTADDAGRYTVLAGVTLTDGVPPDVFSLATPGRWLGVGVQGETESMRMMLITVPYALKAREADMLAGKTLNDFVLSEKLTDSVKTTMKEEGVVTRPKTTDPKAVNTVDYLLKDNGAGGYTNSQIRDSSVNGNVGVGTNTPTQKFQIVGGSFAVFNGPGAAGLTIDTSVAGTSNIYSDYLGGSEPKVHIATYSKHLTGGGVTIDTTGKVGVGTATPGTQLDVAGDVNVTGNIAAKYQDVAEWVETSDRLEAGTLVIVDPKHANRVIPASKAYDTRVAGAVSAQPGLVLGEKSDSKSMVAQSGRVRVKVDASYGAIAIGDLLVASPTAGYAMKSKPIKVGGRMMHRPGTLVGKALEAMPDGKGEILVLLTLQ